MALSAASFTAALNLLYYKGIIFLDFHQLEYISRLFWHGTLSAATYMQFCLAAGSLFPIMPTAIKAVYR